MKNIISLFVLSIVTLLCFSDLAAQNDTVIIPGAKKFLKNIPEGIKIRNNPLDKVPDLVKRTKQFQRERWFYEQRMYPNNFIPTNAYANALKQKNELRVMDDNTSAPWISIGPSPQFVFNSYNTTGRVASVKYHPLDPSIIYIGGANGGVWKSTNSGANWTAMTFDEASLATGCIAIDPTNPNIIYCGTGEATYSSASYSGKGVLKSTDGGQTWTNYSTGLPSATYFSRLVIRPNHPQELFGACGQNGGLVKSTNGGQTWTQVYSERCDDIVFTPSGDTAHITGSGTGYRRSTDGGATWGEDNVLPMGNTRNHIGICKNSPNVLYIATYGGGVDLKVWKSTSGGNSFSAVALPDPMKFNSALSWYCFYVAVSPHDPDFAQVGLIYPWRTTNGGQNFTNIDANQFHVDQQAMDFHPTNSDEILVGSDGGVWKSTNRGTNWINLNSNLNLAQFYRVATDPVSPHIFIGGTQDNGTIIRPGLTDIWNGVIDGDGNAVAFHPLNHLHILGYAAVQTPRYTTNGGANYTDWNAQGTGLTGSSPFMGVITPRPTQAGQFYTTRQKVFLSTSPGSNWTQLNTTGIDGTIQNLAVSRNEAYMFASIGSHIHRSNDSGNTFTDISSGLPDRVLSSIRVHPDPDSANVLAVSFSGFGAGKVYKSTNAGANWINISGNLPDTPINDLLVYYPGQPSSTYIVATDIGVFSTDNYGANWSVLGTGLPNTVCMSLAHDEKPTGKVRVGTMGRGAWETDIATSISNLNNETPEDFKLLQNYPNPFNPSTTIKFTLPKNSLVRIVIYDMLGREVNVVLNKQMNAGSYETVFSAQYLPSGVYMYKLTADNFTAVKKMTLIK